MTANISKNPGHGDSAEHFLYDPETDAYIGFVRVDKATDLRVTYLDETVTNPSSANGEPFADPRWIAKLVTDAHATVDDEIAHLLYRAGEASSHQEQLALSQLAAAKIAFQRLIESHYPLRWATGVPAPLTPDQVKPYEDEIGRLQERNLKQCDEIELQKDLVLSLDKRVTDLLADSDALVVELEKCEEGNVRLASRVSEIACERDKAQAANDRQRDTILAVREAVA